MNPDLAWAIEDVRARLPRYSLFRDYDEGQHRLVFATEKYRNTFGDLFREFADNMCDEVVDGITDRLQIIGWNSTDRGLSEAVDVLWSRNKGQSRTGAVHRHAFREGDGFTIVQQDKAGHARIYKQNPSQMAVRYSADNPDELEVAAKVWRSGARYRCNLYYPDGHIERYATKGLGAEGGLPRAKSFLLMRAGDPALTQAGLDEAITQDDERMPVYHFPNGELSEYGKSILRGVIPLQDALNKAIADMLVAMEFHAYPQRWATGVQVERDPVTGKEISPFQAGEGRVWRVGDKEARFGQFDAAEMTGFLEVQDGFKIAIARKGALPPHHVVLRSGSVQFPSGVALLVAEGKTTKLAKDRQRDWEDVHKAEMAHALSLELGTQDVLAEDLEMEWAPVETRDELALIEMLLLKKELGVPTEQLLKEAGYGDDEIRAFQDELEQENADQEAAMSVLQGGQRAVTVGDARTRTAALGVAPAPAGGGYA